MKKIIVLGTFVFFVLACGGGGVSKSEIAEGKKTFEKLCVACHGADGNMALNDAKKFAESVLTLEERIAVITNGRNMMTPYKGILSEEEIKQVAAYTIELTNAGKK